MLKDLSTVPHFKPLEEIVTLLMQKTQNNNPLFFRVLVAYYFAKMASSMRTNVITHDRGSIPVSMYALNLSVSGSGKGYSTNIMEEQIINQFKDRFLNETFPNLADTNLNSLSVARCNKDPELDQDEALEQLKKEFKQLGPLAFSFDSGTTPAVKQMRQKLLMANAGSVNLEIDEIGSNLLGNVEVLNTFLELYDVGKVKQKLTKNTKENQRLEELDGRTPTNMMLFGTPAKLLDNDKIEQELMSMFETGYARRCFFGYNKIVNKDLELTEQEIYDLKTSKTTLANVVKLSHSFGQLADESNFGLDITMSKDVSLLIISYEKENNIRAAKFKEHEHILQAEMAHRYYKMLKLAGAYAFIEGKLEITSDHVHQAIKLVEESGAAFHEILKREPVWNRLFRFIVDAGRELTQVDLIENLPFYRGTEGTKRQYLSLAAAAAYKENAFIKTKVRDGIEFFSGECLEETDLDNIMIAYSKDISKKYRSEKVPFDKLHKLVQASGHHYTAHGFKDGHRQASNALKGFNLVILDVDDGVSLNTAKLLLNNYKALFATTKRHTDKHNRFRIILPLSHTVKLASPEYSKFMVNVFEWLPFEVDSQTKDIARKWESFNGHYEYNDGELLDAMLFIPETRKESEQKQKILNTESLTNLERWFVLNTEQGNRSNQVIRYALMLVDSGQSVEQVRNAIHAFNDKLEDTLSHEEIDNTIMVSVVRAITKRDIEEDSN